VAVTSPDAGRREWFYCVGGYVCGEQSPIARAASTAGNAVRIKYTYDRDRLMRIDYPNPSTNPGVTYAYGTTAGGSTGDIGAAGFYRTGRVKTRTDETGTFAYQYDALGDVASETATLKNQIAGGSYSGYTTQYKWDNFGRLIDVIIPGTSRTTPPVSTPAETIRYGYDDGGAVTSARGLATGNSTPFEYVKHVGYNEFDEKVRITYGNNVFSTYGYAADTRRLTNANTTVQDAGGSRQTQALVYAYDLVGNVKTRTQNLPFDNVAGDAVLVGGTSTMSFTYDPLNQLIGSDLSMKTKQSERNFGSNYFTYDSIGNITEKNQTDGIEFQDSMGNTTGVQFLNYYDYKPSYGGTQFYDSPHAPSSISNIVLGQQQPPRNLAYDADGNLTSSLVNGSGRFLTWTDTDRVRSVCEGIQSNCNPTPATPMAKALYTADGTRTNNMVTQGTTTTETLYVNQNLTIRNGTLPTKHVYLGDTRIASKVETSASVWNQYYYHSDNLQSTQYVTTAGQTVVQHLEYFPSGDIWREQKGATPIDKIAHATAFTGKEMDAPSNYYYFGARYYEPQTQMWLSPDPILASYMKRGAAGGSPKNLDLYTYALNNPIVMRDSDGRWATAALAYYAASHRPPAAVNIEVWTEPVNDRSAGKKSYESGALKAWPRSMNYPRHTYIRVACDHCDPKLFPAEFQQPFDVRLEIQGPLVNDRAHGSATPFRHDPQNASSVQQLPWISNNYALQSPMASQYPPSPCGLAACLTNAYKTSAANLPIYGAQGPNSNTFANTVLEMCGVSTFFRKSEYGAYHQDEKHK